MSTRIALTHRLVRRFPRRVALPTHWLRLRPAPHARARITAYALRVRTEPHFLNWLRDPFENHLARLDLPEPVTSLDVEVALVAELATVNPFDFLLEPDAATHPFAYEPQLAKELAPYLQSADAGPRLAKWLAGLPRAPRSVVERIDDLTRTIATELGSDDTARSVVDLEAALARQAGSPRELAWLLTLSLRALGLAARFTSGYRIVAGARLHAWSEVHLPGAGWVGLDPSAGVFTDAHYVPLACAPDALRTEPITGEPDGLGFEDRATIEARVLAPAPPAWPFRDADWTAIRAIGDAVDADLARHGVALAVGRSIAVASAADGDLPEWTTVALGAGKRRAAEALLARLHARLAPGGVVQRGSGTWYAGEAAPRWRLLSVWRSDGTAVAPHAQRLGVVDGEHAVASTIARDAGVALARALGLPDAALVSACADPLQRAWRDSMAAAAQPTAAGFARPSAEDLRDPERRRTLADTLSASAAGAPVGWVLPLEWDASNDAWRTGTWALRRSRLYVLDGTLPLGDRLPLQSLGAARDGGSGRDANDRDGVAPRTAVCFEVRDGRLCVFLPPLREAAHYLALVSAVGDVAGALDVPIALEGYEPSEHPSLRRIVVEPDAGVLRITLPPAATAAEHAALLETVYTEAERAGLRAERRLADGTREPLGGAAAIVLGGPTPDASPFARRPELARALVVAWQRHPSLSYFFATRAVGADGAAPRADEGRDDALYELGLALDRVPAGESALPWVPDRLLRHLLADRVGDVRRAELCMDELFSPDDAARRLGRLTLRGFETPPCAALAVVQSTLVAAIVARFARDPRVPELVRWGADLHDRWLLPSVLWDDLRAVLADLDGAGYAFELAWFEPFLDFHFPRAGRVQLGDQALELRLAHEPWPVLAEEASGGGMARFVDSANQRVEVRASGLVPSRWVVACNGRRVPLRPTGVRGEWVGSVRYKAWTPPATLHPTTPATSVLVFDLVDTWTGRARGGCRLYPSPPTSLGVSAMPSPRLDADGERGPQLRAIAPLVGPPGRRAGRFVADGSGAGSMHVPPEELGVGCTLDLTVARISGRAVVSLG
jgi:uncharacterized protein (DUF2126 family)